MSDLTRKIRLAQMLAGEQAVVADLEAKGLIPKEEIAQTPGENATESKVPLGLVMKYFVLKPYKNDDMYGRDPYAKASRVAMLAYAKAIKSTDIQLAWELQTWVQRIEEDFALDAGG